MPLRAWKAATLPSTRCAGGARCPRARSRAKVAVLPEHVGLGAAEGLEGGDVAVDLLAGRWDGAPGPGLVPEVAVLPEHVGLGAAEGLEGGDVAVDLLAGRWDGAPGPGLVPEVAVFPEHVGLGAAQRLERWLDRSQRQQGIA